MTTMQECYTLLAEAYLDWLFPNHRTSDVCTFAQAMIYFALLMAAQQGRDTDD